MLADKICLSLRDSSPFEVPVGPPQTLGFLQVLSLLTHPASITCQEFLQVSDTLLLAGDPKVPRGCNHWFPNEHIGIPSFCLHKPGWGPVLLILCLGTGPKAQFFKWTEENQRLRGD